MNDPSLSKNTSHAGIDWSVELTRHDRWLRTVIAARCGESQAVDEVLQEVSIAALKQAAPIRDETKVAPWLYQIAVRQSLMYRRKHGRRRKLEKRYAERLDSQPHSAAEASPLDWLIATERQELVRKGIDRLSPKDAEILLLKYTEDWTYQEIAQHLNTTESAIESRLHRARKKLRTLMSTLELVESNK